MRAERHLRKPRLTVVAGRGAGRSQLQGDVAQRRAVGDIDGTGPPGSVNPAVARTARPISFDAVERCRPNLRQQIDYRKVRTHAFRSLTR
jgi:hypothetical protein